MKGSRTIIFTLVMAILGLAGAKISPDTVNSWLDVFIPAWAIGAILLRQLTTSPVFQREVASLGVPPEILDGLHAIGASITDGNVNLAGAIAQLNQAAGTLAGHPLADPATLGVLTEALTKLTSPLFIGTDLSADPDMTVKTTIGLDVQAAHEVLTSAASTSDPAPQPSSQTPAPAAQ